MKKNNEKKILTIKNNKNNEYSKTTKIINEEKNQILKHSISCHADNYMTKKSDYHDNEHENK